LECRIKDFIVCRDIKNKNLCDDIIEYHKNSPDKHSGQVSGGYNNVAKKSTDVVLDGELLKLYFEELNLVLNSYVEIFPYCNYYSPYTIIQPVNIQHYAPGEAFYAWHSERTGANEPFASRHLVFMTYLNDVTDGGETEWIHQNFKIKPEKGLTVIWPTDWTYTHRGLPSLTENKYIVTGWFNYVNQF
jgi:hypothetical protein